MNEFKEGQLVAYLPSSEGIPYKCEVGVVKRIDGDNIWVWYHSGDTAANTPKQYLRPIENASSITSLVGRIK